MICMYCAPIADDNGEETHGICEHHQECDLVDPCPNCGAFELKAVDGGRRYVCGRCHSVFDAEDF